MIWWLLGYVVIGLIAGVIMVCVDYGMENFYADRPPLGAVLMWPVLLLYFLLFIGAVLINCALIKFGEIARKIYKNWKKKSKRET